MQAQTEAPGDAGKRNPERARSQRHVGCGQRRLLEQHREALAKQQQWQAGAELVALGDAGQQAGFIHRILVQQLQSTRARGRQRIRDAAQAGALQRGEHRRQGFVPAPPQRSERLRAAGAAAVADAGFQPGQGPVDHRAEILAHHRRRLLEQTGEDALGAVGDGTRCEGGHGPHRGCQSARMA